MKENENTTIIRKKDKLLAIIAHLKGLRKIETQKDFADQLGYNKSNISSAVNGNEKYLTDSLFDKINEVYHLELVDFEDRYRLGGKSTNRNYNSEGEIRTVNEPLSNYGEKKEINDLVATLKVLTESNQILVKSNSDLVRMLNSKL